MKKIIFTLLILHCSVLFSFAQLVHDFKVNDDTTTNVFRYHASISTNKNGLTAIVWEEYVLGNVFAQIFDNNFNRINGNLRVNLLSDTSFSPDVIVRNDGSFGIVRQIYSCKTLFKLFDNNGFPVTSDIRINDSLIGWEDHPIIGCDSSGRFIIFWTYHDYGNPPEYNAYFQILDSYGNKIGNNIKVNEGTEGFAADILVSKNGSFIVVWCEYTPLENIYLKMYNRYGISLGLSQRVNDTLTEYGGCSGAKIVQDSSGNFVVAFNEYLLNANCNFVRYQRYDKNGIKIGVNKELPGSPCNAYLSSFDSDEFGNLIFQINFPGSSTYFIYNIRIDRYDNSIGTYFPVSNEYIVSGKASEDIKLYNKKIINVWRDTRLGFQPQIYANVRSYINPDSTVGIINITSEIPAQYKLHQNFPNPFNPTTKIKFEVPLRKGGIQGVVSLKVFDISGREIQTLMNEKQNPGIYEVTFDGSGLASGVYFYQLKTGDFVETKKMLMIK
jgi:hypothetical protein